MVQALEASRDFFNFMQNKDIALGSLDETTNILNQEGILNIINEAAIGLSEASGVKNPEFVSTCILLGYSLKLHLDKRSLENIFNLE